MHSVSCNINMTEQIKIISLDNLAEKLAETDNSVNTLFISQIPQVCKDHPCLVGIDEAGRGPVLGPMVYGISFIPINEAGLLLELGCDDSKALTEEKRDEIFKNICSSSKKIGWAVEVISPNVICKNMLSRSKVSLNEVSMDSAIGLIKLCIANNVNIANIYVDTVGKPEKYQTYLKSIFPQYKIIVEKKADSTYAIVSAASICAKVTRDHALKVWKFRENIKITQEEFGSGYPGDPVTKKFLVDYCNSVFGFPKLVRFSWSTAEKALENTAYHVEWENATDDEASTNTVITSYFKAANPKLNKGIKKHEFFKQRCLSSTTEL